MDDLIGIAAGDVAAFVAPKVGGSVASLEFRSGGRCWPVLRGSAALPTTPLEAGSFPLIPFVNRIAGGAFDCAGRTVRLTPNMAGDPSPLHGQGWLATWRLIERDERSVRLGYFHTADEWPWDYEGEQLLRVDEQGLTVDLTCANRSPDPMPCGLGHHPYFPCTGRTRLTTGVSTVWTVDDNILPLARVPAEGPFDLEDRLICGQGLDNGFGGWSGSARLETPGIPFATVMSSSDAGYFQVYSPLAGELIAAEPVSHANGALNHSEPDWATLGIKMLNRDETFRLSMRIDVV